MCHFVRVGEHSINLDQVTEIKWDCRNREGERIVKVYFPGGGDEERDFTTLTAEEGENLFAQLEEVEGVR